MPWVPFTEADVRAISSEMEVERFQEVGSKNFPDDSGDPVAPAANKLPAIVSQVLARFRGEIRSNPADIPMGPAGTLPEFCIESAAVIARDKLTGLPPYVEGMPNERYTENRNAVSFLNGLKSRKEIAFADDSEAGEPDALVGGEPFLEFFS